MLTRAQWVKLRDKAGVPEGAVKGVRIGPMLDDWQKAGNDFKKRAKVDEKLVKDATTYHKGLAGSKEKALKDFGPSSEKEVLDYALQDLKSTKALAAPAEALRANLADIVSDGKAWAETSLPTHTQNTGSPTQSVSSP